MSGSQDAYPVYFDPKEDPSASSEERVFAGRGEMREWSGGRPDRNAVLVACSQERFATRTNSRGGRPALPEPGSEDLLPKMSTSSGGNQHPKRRRMSYRKRRQVIGRPWPGESCQAPSTPNGSGPGRTSADARRSRKRTLRSPCFHTPLLLRAAPALHAPASTAGGETLRAPSVNGACSTRRPRSEVEPPVGGRGRAHGFRSAG